MVYLNEASERRKKKDLLFEERSDEFAFRRNRRRPIFPVVRRPSRKNPKSILSDGGECPEAFLTFSPGMITLIKIKASSLVLS